MCIEREMGASEVFWDLVLDLKRSGCWFKTLERFGGSQRSSLCFLLCGQWKKEEEGKKQRNAAQKFGSKKLDLSCMSSFQVVFSGGINIVVCILKAENLCSRVKQQQSWGYTKDLVSYVMPYPLAITIHTIFDYHILLNVRKQMIERHML